MNPKYAHIKGSVFQLGLIHLHHLRCIYWYGSGFGDHHIEWVDRPTIRQGIWVVHDLEQKDLELRRGGTEGFPCISYKDLDVHHQTQASKDRTQMFADKIFQITEETGTLFRQWLGQEVHESDRAGMGFETPHGRPVNATTGKHSH